MSTDALNDARTFKVFPRATFTAGIRVFQRDHQQWGAYNFGETQTNAANMFLGMVEEIGELAHATLKHNQGIRGMTDEKFEALSKDCVADLFVFLTGYATARGWDLADLVADTWERVRDRDWRANASNGGDSTATVQNGGE